MTFDKNLFELLCATLLEWLEDFGHCYSDGFVTLIHWYDRYPAVCVAGPSRRRSVDTPGWGPGEPGLEGVPVSAVGVGLEGKLYLLERSGWPVMAVARSFSPGRRRQVNWQWILLACR